MCVGRNQLLASPTVWTGDSYIVPQLPGPGTPSHPPAVTINTILPSSLIAQITFTGPAECRGHQTEWDDASKVSVAPLSQQ